MDTKKIVSRDPEVVNGELVFAGTRVEVKTLVDYPPGRLPDFLEGFPTVGREQARPTWRRPAKLSALRAAHRARQARQVRG